MTTIDVTVQVDPAAAGKMAATIYGLPGVCSIQSTPAVIDYVAGRCDTVDVEAEDNVGIIVEVRPQHVDDIAAQTADLPAVNHVEYTESLLQVTA